MPDIYHQFPVFGPADKVFDAVATPEGLDAWWSLTSKGEPAPGNIYELFFGEGYDWRARVTECVPNELFELEIYDSMPDWEGSRVRFELGPFGSDPDKAATEVRFSHTGWPEGNDHYRISSFCWAMYLRLMKKWVEDGTVVEYAKRLDA